MFQKVMEEHQTKLARWNAEQHSQLLTKMQSDIKSCIDQKMEQLESRVYTKLHAKFVPEHAAHLQRHEELGERIESAREEATDQIETVRSEVTDLVDHMDDVLDTKFDDGLYSMRMTLDEHIKDEMADAEDRVVKRLESTAVLSLSFS